MVTDTSDFSFNVKIICSFHMEIAQCNPFELYKIIDSIKPDVIFEELPTNVFQSIYSGLHPPKTVESRAVQAYIKSKRIKHFPVDSYFYDLNDLFSEYDFISKSNDEYNNLFVELISSVGNFGYRFLNSKECILLLHKLKTLELRILTENGTKELLEKYQKESYIHDQREIEILKNISNYCITDPFNNAILICGVDHKQGILDKINSFSYKNSTKINWSVYGE